jgi:hypothetical protein
MKEGRSDQKLKLLELFAGSCSVGKVAKSLDMDVFSVDVKPFDGVDLVADIEFLQPSDIPFQPDIIWASIPCTTYSMAGISHHRESGVPISDFAMKSDRLSVHTLDLIRYYNCIYFIENPRGYLRKMPFMRGIPRTTVWYCRYGDFRAKPTDIWSNHLYSIFNTDGWQSRPQCFNGNVNCHHEKAPRGTNSGTQGQSGNYKRSILPPDLCLEILQSVVGAYGTRQQLMVN